MKPRSNCVQHHNLHWVFSKPHLSRNDRSSVITTANLFLLILTIEEYTSSQLFLSLLHFTFVHYIHTTIKFNLLKSIHLFINHSPHIGHNNQSLHGFKHDRSKTNWLRFAKPKGCVQSSSKPCTRVRVYFAGLGHHSEKKQGRYNPYLLL